MSDRSEETCHPGAVAPDRRRAERTLVTARFALSIVAAVALATPVGAQDFPSKPLRLIVPYAPGGGLDVVGRPVAQRLSEQLGQPVVFENRPGAGTTIGTSAVAKSAPDGHTLLLTLSALTIGPALYPNLPYDPLRDFAPVIWLGTSAYLLAVHPSVPVTSVKQLVALSKAQAGRMNYSSPGQGTDPHMAAELFKLLTGAQWQHVPYNGGGPAATAVMGGQVDLTFLPTSVGTPFVKSGKLKAIGLSTAKRSALLPELPTLAESGVPGFAAEAWSGVLAPAATPRDIIGKLNAALQRIVQSPDYRSLLEGRLIEPVGGSPELLGQRLREDIAKWRRVVKDAGLRLE